ncbi:MAG TPA: phytanoyl-CoA dioxygenase family protein [Steroidobacteraceae bacterium]|nr:phytanoyl-CoA dioxygenase family protein [Steroidobacteraceae bacterium]
MSALSKGSGAPADDGGSSLARANPLTQDELVRFRRDGFVVLRKLFSPEEIAEIRDTFMAMAAHGPVEGLSEKKPAMNRGATPEYGPGDPLALYPRMLHPHKHLDKPVGPLSLRYMLHPKLEPILTALFGEEPVAVQSMFYFKPPGSRGQDLHQDNYYLRVKPKTCVAAWVTIDDADEDNGGMRCVPGTGSYPLQCPEESDLSESFTTEHVAPPAGSRAQALTLEAGDVLFFNGSVIHGSGPNLSATRFRRAFICHYVPLGTTELSDWYSTPVRFNGELRSIPAATGGGPCGSTGDGAQGPH